LNKFYLFADRNLLILTIISAFILAVLIPQAGISLGRIPLISPLIILIFFCQGTGVETKELNNKSIYIKLLIFGTVISQLLAPATGYLLVKLLDWQADEMVGFILMCCMAPTLISGTMLAVQGGGDRASCIILTVFINLAAIILIPINLSWTLGATVQINSMELLCKLIFLILLPSLAGFVFRLKQDGFVKKNSQKLKFTAVLSFGVIIFISISRQNQRLSSLHINDIVKYLLAGLAVHVLLLLIGYIGSGLLKIKERSRRALAICCSQKTLPIVIAIWSSVFAKDYPLAILPAIVFHMSQIYFDGVVVYFWSKNSMKN